MIKEKYSITDIEIKEEIYKALEKLNAPMELLAAVGSWMDTIDPEDVLALLIDWNRGEKSFDIIKSV